MGCPGKSMYSCYMYIPILKFHQKCCNLCQVSDQLRTVFDDHHAQTCTDHSRHLTACLKVSFSVVLYYLFNNYTGLFGVVLYHVLAKF